jgi:hypothetical protein
MIGQDIFRRIPPRGFSAALLALAVAAAALLGGCSCREHGHARISFDHQAVGALPEGFATALTGGGGPVSWAVRDDATAPGHRVLVQESRDDTSYRFPMCIYQRFAARDVKATVRWRALGGEVDQAGGIVLRWQPENYYIARANALEDNLDLFKTLDGKRIKIAEAPVKVTPGDWHSLGFLVSGPHLFVFFDGALVLAQDDDSLPEAGEAGLWTKADSVSAFADLQLSDLGRLDRMIKRADGN